MEKGIRNKIVAVTVVILIGVIIVKGRLFESEWKRHQREYRQTIEDIYGKPIQIPEGIQEVGSLRIGRTDLCVTCHLGVEEPLLEGTLLKSPYGPHPIIYHSYEEYGCTICHQGNGAALTADEAHNNPKFPQYRMLPVEFTEASCGKCHRTRIVKDAWDLTEGRRLIEKYGCYGCHWIPGYESYKKSGYDLTGVGSKVNHAWLVKWLNNPREYSKSSIMPSFKLKEEEINLLSDFLLSLTIPEIEEVAREIKKATRSIPRYQLIERGREQVHQRECNSCHAFDGKGGRMGPDLDKIASKVKKDWLLAWLKYPSEYFPATTMPQFSFPDSDIEAIGEYLMASMVDHTMPVEEILLINKPADSISDENVREGKKLFLQYGCYGCHQLTAIAKDDIKKKGIGPSLGGIGSKNVSELDFGKSSIPRTLSDYIFNKLKKPSVFSDTVIMPDYHFPDDQARQITVALLSLSSEPIPEKLIIREKSRRKYKPIGDFGAIMNQYQCLDCHVINNTGNPLGPDLSRAGSKLKREWLIDYLKNPYPIRPLVIEKMPDFGLSDEEVLIITEYFDKNLTSENIPDEIFPSTQLPQSLIEEGKRLFYEEYACHSCHIIGNQGGIYGPSLDNAGGKFKSGWIYAWLRNPRAIDPLTIIPNFDIAPDHAKALTAFVIAQKPVEATFKVEFHQVSTPEDNPLPENVRGVRRYQANKGKAVYFRYCVFCHGSSGKGDGSNAASLQIPPPDFTDVETMAGFSVGYLKKVISEGGKGVGKSAQMPPYGKTLNSMEIQQAVTYIRTFIPLKELAKYRRINKQSE